MKKVLVIMMIAFATVSCSDDDNNTPEQQKVKLVNAITLNGDAYGSVDYNSDKKVQKMTILGDGIYDFSYSGDQIATLLFTSNAEFNPVAPKYFTFSYDSNGKINKIMADNLQKNVVYTAADNSYYVTEVGTNLKYRFFLDTNDDLIKAIFYNGNQVTEEDVFTYDSGKGCMANSNRISTALALAYPTNDTYLAAFFAKKPVKSTYYHETSMNTSNTDSYTNVLDSDGFIVSGTTLIIDQTFVLAYQYTQL